MKANPFGTPLDDEGALNYLRMRPTYPQAALDTITSLASGSRGLAGKVCVDIGAGSGQLTGQLVEAGFAVTAVEPSESMRGLLVKQPWSSQIRVVNGTGEATGIKEASVDLLTWADCFHWLSKEEALQEAARIVRPSGLAVMLTNQLDTRKPWVHRLTRIMRSGDVAKPDVAPTLDENWRLVAAETYPWEKRTKTEDILALARTRAAFLRSGVDGKERMQQNLDWYLHDHLGFSATQEVLLPYRTLLWGWERI